MGRSVDVDFLVGAEEIARRLAVANRQTVHKWRERNIDFPEPVTVIERTRVWFWPDVEAWARETGRMPYQVRRR